MVVAEVVEEEAEEEEEDEEKKEEKVKKRNAKTLERKERASERGVAREGMPAKGERGKATDFSIAAIMAPRGPSFGHYHLQGIGNAATGLECPTAKGFVAGSTLDHREFPRYYQKSIVVVRLASSDGYRPR